MLTADRSKTSPDNRHATEQVDPTLLKLLAPPYGRAQCQALLQQLLDRVEWQHEYIAFGRRFSVPRVQAWYADDGTNYRYSNDFLQRRDWIPLLADIKADVERITGHAFNAVLLTYYRDGDDHVTLHADDEPELGDSPTIASLSLGAARRFEFRLKSGGAMHGIDLYDGDLLLMQPEFQRLWLHGVPQQSSVKEARINLTFRNVLTA